MNAIYRIGDAFGEARGWCYDLYVSVLGWVWPFYLAANGFYYMAVAFNRGAQASYDLAWWASDIEYAISRALTWENVRDWLTSWLPNLESLSAWFWDWWGNVQGVISNWWAWAQYNVQDWIAAALQNVNSLIAGWNDFWTTTWPAFTAQFDGFKAEWTQFWTVTVPNLLTLQTITTWWESRVKDVSALISGAFAEREPFWSGWQEVRENVLTFIGNPFDWLWARFADWFLGPEG